MAVEKIKKKKEIITLPKNCEILKANDTLSFNFDPFAKQIKDVILIKDVMNGVICELRNWIPYIKKYPRYPFLLVSDLVKTMDFQSISL